MEKRPEETNDVLSDPFGEDAGSKATKYDGIYLDQAQINILERSWHCSNRERLSALRMSTDRFFQFLN